MKGVAITVAAAPAALAFIVTIINVSWSFTAPVMLLDAVAAGVVCALLAHGRLGLGALAFAARMTLHVAVFLATVHIGHASTGDHVVVAALLFILAVITAAPGIALGIYAGRRTR